MFCLNKKMRIHCLLTILFLVFFPYSACSAGRSTSHTLQIKGSDTMVNLGQAWAEEFMRTHPETSIAVTGGGSGTGIAAILSGTCDIAQSSRDVKPEELSKAQANGKPIVQTNVAIDGLAVVVNLGNPVSQLTLDQLADIFTGKVTNWKEVGGNDLPILILSRERNSGTHVYFLEHVLRRGNPKGAEEFAASALMMPSSQGIAQEVESSEAAIGYLGMGYVTPKQKVLAIGKIAGGSYILPTLETAQNGQYPISRPLYFLTRGEPEGEIKSFVEFVLSSEGQEIVRVLDFVPVKSN